MYDYQRKNNNPYWLDPTLYRRVLYLVRDYPRMRQEYIEGLEGSPPPLAGQPRGSGYGDPTARTAERQLPRSEELQAVERALLVVPPEYRRPLLDWICKGRWPIAVPCGKNTQTRWKQRFLWQVAKNLWLI